VIAAFVSVVAACGGRPQIRWDVGGETGGMKRVATHDAAPGSGTAREPDVGPVLVIQGHVALAPMIRAGLYFAEDVSPSSGVAPRSFSEGGLQLKVTPPLLPLPWRLSLLVGAGYAYAYAPSYRTTVAPHGDRVSPVRIAEHGSLVELPLGLSLGLKLTPSWVLVAELSARLGIGFFGPMYDPGSEFLGRDSFALSLAIGLSFER
jgi:hypothetical protein